MTAAARPLSLRFLMMLKEIEYSRVCLIMTAPKRMDMSHFALKLPRHVYESPFDRLERVLKEAKSPRGSPPLKKSERKCGHRKAGDWCISPYPECKPCEFHYSIWGEDST